MTFVTPVDGARSTRVCHAITCESELVKMRPVRYARALCEHETVLDDEALTTRTENSHEPQSILYRIT